MSNLPRIGYAALSTNLQAPGDRRRFAAYARARNLPFELARFGERYDIVILSEAADISIWPDYPHGKVVYDLIDSYLAVPRTNWRQLLRGSIFYAIGKHQKLRPDYLSCVHRMCQRSDAVICATEEQRSDIRRLCENVHIILDLHSTVITKIKSDYVASQPFRLVWEGLPTNIPQLVLLSPVLRSIAATREVELYVITDPFRFRLQGRFGRIDTRRLLARHFDRVRFCDWDEKTFSGIITSCDLAVIPIDLNDPFAAGKPENKLLLLWRMGLPVVASASRAYGRAMREAGTPHLACVNESDWIAALEGLMSDQAARRDAAMRGRSHAEREQGEPAILARWDSLFASLGFSFAPSPKHAHETVNAR